jgi:hypothetical protein
MKTGLKVAIWALAALALSVVVFGVGSALRGSGGRSNAGGRTTVVSELAATDSGPAPQSTSNSTADKSAGGAPGASAESAPSVGIASAASTKPMVITEASMAMTVNDVNAGVDSVRKIVAGVGGSIAQLSVSAGPGEPTPLAYRADASSSAGRQPSSASITVRVPAARLAETQAKLAPLGTIDSQAESQSDVTQQHVDMSARLKNLRAEEVRVRSFLGKAGDVGEMLAIERELTRIRGDIESMQAQVDYLERQSAMATLTLALSQPGAIVRPAATNWGFGESVTEGVQAAASLVRTMTTGAIAISPLVALALVLWLALRLARRARGRHNGTQPVEAA